MTNQINLDIPLDATVELAGHPGGPGPQTRDAREVLLDASKAANTRPIQRGNNGTRYDVRFRDDDAKVIWKMAGGIELEKNFTARKA